MGQVLRILVAGAFTFVIFFGFNNCSKVGFSDASSNQVTGTGDPDPNPEPPTEPPIIPPPVVVLKNCDLAAENGTLLTLNQTVNFEDTAIESGHLDKKDICEFETNDNLSMLDTFMRARYEQEQVLNLPANAVVCDISMTTALQKFSYDDIFFLTFNNRLLATNNKTAVNQRLSPERVLATTNGSLVEVFDYDWLKLRGAAFVNQADDYCFGSKEGLASCSWPITEQMGQITFQFDRELLIGLGQLAQSNMQSFKFAITGDNDPTTDCYHEKLEFNMAVKYYIP